MIRHSRKENLQGNVGRTGKGVCWRKRFDNSSNTGTVVIREDDDELYFD